MTGRSVIGISAREQTTEKRNLQYFEGISRATAGATGIAMQRVVIPPGAQAVPHSHDGYETAIYVLQGKVETRYGEHLELSVISEAGEYVFIPPYVPHQPVNLSQTDVAIAIIARTNPEEQEPTIPYPG